MAHNGRFRLSRSAGPMYRPRPFSVWQRQYENIDTSPPVANVEHLIPTICGSLDLVVFRLHTLSGHPATILHHPFYQLGQNVDGNSAIPPFDRIGIEWHPLWATPEGRKEFCDEAVRDIILLAGRRERLTTKLYWLVDGIPRPQWDKYPPAIPAVFSRVIEKRKHGMLKWWEMEEAQKDRLLEHHDLYQEFEANGRRYYVVFVLSNWHDEYCVEESFLDPAIDWDEPFPGGEDLWPEKLRAPVRFAHELRKNIGTDIFCSFVLSWEPM